MRFRLLLPLFVVGTSFAVRKGEALGDVILPSALLYALGQPNDYSDEGGRLLRRDNTTSHNDLDMLVSVLQENFDENELAVLQGEGYSSSKEGRSLFVNPFCFFRIFSGVLSNFYREADLGGDLVRRKDYNTIRKNGQEMVDVMRVHDVGPLSNQGVFWLNVKPERGMSELFSYANASDQGGGLSSGELSETNDPAYRVRALGDKMWAFTGYGFAAAKLTSIMDASFDFVILEGNTTWPTKLRATLDLGLPGTCKRVQLAGCLGEDSGLNDAVATLQNTPGSNPHPVYGTSFIWLRESKGLFASVTDQYEMIQIIDGNGVRLQPAYDEFINREKDKTYVTNELKSQVRGPRCKRHH